MSDAPDGLLPLFRVSGGPLHTPEAMKFNARGIASKVVSISSIYPTDWIGRAGEQSSTQNLTLLRTVACEEVLFGLSSPQPGDPYAGHSENSIAVSRMR